MRTVGRFLTWLGAFIGVAVSAAMLFHVGAPGATWLINVALVKLGLVSSLTLIASGAGFLRFSNARERRDVFAATHSEPIRVLKEGRDDRDRGS